MRLISLLFTGIALLAAAVSHAQADTAFIKSYALDFSSATPGTGVYSPVINVVIDDNKIWIHYNPVDTTVTVIADSSITLGNMSKDVVSSFVSSALSKRFYSKSTAESYNLAALKTGNQVADDYFAFVAEQKSAVALQARQSDLARALDGIDSLYEKAFFIKLNIVNKDNLVPLNYNGPKNKKFANNGKKDNKTAFIKVERVTLGFSNWNLGNVVVYGKVMSQSGGGTYDSSITLNNLRVIPVSSRNVLSKIQNEPLVNSSREYNITLSQVVSITPNDSLVFDLYVPKRTYIELRPETDADVQKYAMKPAIASFFNYAIFGDLTGYIQDDAPNGKFQTEVSAMLPLWVRPVRMRQEPKRTKRRLSLFLAKSFAPEICLAKFGTDNRFLPVQYFTDTVMNDTAIVSSTLIKHVNNMNMLQFANFWAGGRFNIFTLEGRNPSWAVYINFRFRYLKTELADTSRGFNNLPQVRTVSYEPEFVFKRKISRNFYADLTVSVNMLRLYSNAYSLSFEKQYGDARDSVFVATPEIKFEDFFNGNAFYKSEYRKQLIWTPHFTLRYSPPNSPMSGAFVRISYPFNEPQNNSFLIAQIGISKPISNLLAKAKAAAPTGN